MLLCHSASWQQILELGATVLWRREDLRFWLWEKGSLVQPLSSQTALVGPIARLQFRWLKKNLQDIETWQMRKVWLWIEDTHTHNIPTSYNWCDISCLFASPLSFAHPARSVWVMRAWPTFKTRRLTKSPKSWLIEVFFMEDFHPPLYDTCHLSPKMGGGVNWENPVLLSTRIFLEMSCGWAITVDICRYLILPSMVCLKLSKGCGFRWHEHWHLGSVSFEKSLKTVNISVYSCWCFSAFLAKVIAELFIWN